MQAVDDRLVDGSADYHPLNMQDAVLRLPCHGQPWFAHHADGTNHEPKPWVALFSGNLVRWIWVVSSSSHQLRGQLCGHRYQHTTPLLLVVIQENHIRPKIHIGASICFYLQPQAHELDHLATHWANLLTRPRIVSKVLHLHFLSVI
jgi:hypothetical protein